MLLNPRFTSKPLYDVSNYDCLLSRCCVKYTEGIDYNITPSFVNQFDHYKTFKYVLSCIYEPLSGNVVLYDKPTLPIIDKPEQIDLEKLVRPNRFPCNFEKVYNESYFSKYLQVHYHKIKNGHNLTQINTPTWSGFV